MPVAAILSSVSMHDSLAAIPLSRLTAAPLPNLYDVMDAAYCKDLGHVPLIDHNPRGGEKIEFDPAEAVRYNERTVVERMSHGIPLRINARRKDEFGGNPIWVKGNTRVMSQPMFGLLVLTVDQLMRLLQ